MKAFACSPTDVPSELYRVHYPGSRTVFSPQKGFEAGNTTTTFDDGNVNAFKEAVEQQFTWGYRDSLPFISLFSELEHAENWACKMPWGGNGEAEGAWELYTIDTRDIARTHLFYKLSELVAMLDLNIPEGARQHIEGAYICLHRIPAAAIVSVRTPEEVERDREERRMLEIEEADRYDYLGDYGNDDSDREMLQENYNSIFEANIEDSW